MNQNDILENDILENIKQGVINQITTCIKAMTKEEFLNYFSEIDFFSKKIILDLKSLDSLKVKVTYLKGLLLLIQFLDRFNFLSKDEKEYIKLNFNCILKMLDFNFNKSNE